MKASRLVRAARKRKGLTQRELAAKTRIPQPMISSIERGIQDPRYSTLQRIFRACDLEVDVVNVAGGRSRSHAVHGDAAPASRRTFAAVRRRTSRDQRAREECKARPLQRSWST